jgi:hypothetical protein
VSSREPYINTLQPRARRFPLPFREACSPEEAAELNSMLDALPAAITLAGDLLRQLSIHDPKYLAADAEVSRILTRINELMNQKHADASIKR